MRLLHYVLNGREPVPVETPEEWAVAFGRIEDRRVGYADLGKGVSVSTVFLGLDHNFLGEGPPLLFETMVFGGEHDGDCYREPTWENAEATHERVVAELKGKTDG